MYITVYQRVYVLIVLGEQRCWSKNKSFLIWSTPIKRHNMSWWTIPSFTNIHRLRENSTLKTWWVLWVYHGLPHFRSGFLHEIGPQKHPNHYPNLPATVSTPPWCRRNKANAQRFQAPRRPAADCGVGDFSKLVPAEIRSKARFRRSPAQSLTLSEMNSKPIYYRSHLVPKRGPKSLRVAWNHPEKTFRIGKCE